MPGFTPISMFPMLWEAEGVSFPHVVDELVSLAPLPAHTPAVAAHPSAALRTATGQLERAGQT